jgi:hypothetical protein
VKDMAGRLTMEDKEQLLEMYKCHFTAKEVAAKLSIGYGTVIPYFRSFNLAEVKQYDKLKLIPEGNNNDAINK